MKISYQFMRTERVDVDSDFHISGIAPDGGSISGQISIYNNVIGVYMSTKNVGEDVDILIKSKKINLNCVSSVGFTIGKRIYFDPLNNRRNLPEKCKHSFFVG